jgi:hypothetical protein
LAQFQHVEWCCFWDINIKGITQTRVNQVWRSKTYKRFWFKKKKSIRVARFQHETAKSAMDLMASAGIDLWRQGRSFRGKYASIC